MKKLYNVLSYLGILWIVGLVLGKNKDTRFHVGQGIMLTIYMILFYILVALITFILKIVSFGILGFVGKILYMLYLLSLVYFIVIGVSNALENKKIELPLIGKYAFYK